MSKHVVRNLTLPLALLALITPAALAAPAGPRLQSNKVAVAITPVIGISGTDPEPTEPDDVDAMLAQLLLP
jgi:hypothetical protein